MLTLDALVAPFDCDSFLNDVIGQSAFLLPGTPNKFSGLISWSVLNRLLEFGGLAFPRLRLFRGGEEIPHDRYFGVGSSGYQRPLTRGLSSELQNGAILAIESVGELHEEISALCLAVENRLRLPVLADLYAAWQDKPTAPLRWNEHDVIILQIDGERNWRVYSTTYNFLDSRLRPEPAGEPAWQGNLRANDLLYVPRGWWYHDEPVGDHSMYVALKFRNPTGADIIGRLFTRLTSTARMNVNTPASRNTEMQRRFIQYIQNTLADAAETPGLLPDCLAEMRAFAESRCGFWLPWSAHAVPLPPSPDWGIVPLVRFPSTNELKHLEFEDAFEILVDGQPVRFSEQVACVVKCIFENCGLTIASLLASCGPDVEPDRVIEYLLELVNAGVVCFREPSGRSENTGDIFGPILMADSRIP